MKKNGFTLLEVLLTVATISILATVSMPVYQSFMVRNDLDIAAAEIAQSLGRAQALSTAMDGDTSWGVRSESGRVVLFRGASYVARDVVFDEVYSVPGSIFPSGVQEVVFTKFTGLPASTGAFILTSNTNETRTITINSKGMVAY
jgi:prepilin-type N-terminal cleavage/methylation domain-containing protein